MQYNPCVAVLRPEELYVTRKDTITEGKEREEGTLKTKMVHLTLEFGGGLELLFQSVKTHHVDVPEKNGEKQLTIGALLFWIRDNLLKERPEMFMKGNSVRPGVLVLVNDCDWELCGQLEATLEEKDNVVFISTLHGG